MSEVLNKPTWLQAIQKTQYEKFLQRGIPTRKEEHWKYTTISPELISMSCQHTVGRAKERSDVPAMMTVSMSLPSFTHPTASDLSEVFIVFYNGVFSKELSHLENLCSKVIFSSLSQAYLTYETLLQTYLSNEVDVQQYPFATLNHASFDDGVFLYIPKNISLPKPLHIIFLQDEETMVCPRNLIIAEDSAEVAIVEEYVSDAVGGFTNTVTNIHAGKNSKIQFYKIQREAPISTHLANIFIEQQQDSSVNFFTLSKGAKLSREDVTINLTGNGAECALLGLTSLLHDNQHADHHLIVNHMADYGVSSMVYKNILDKKSKSIFNGKVHVHANAKGNSANQSNQNLLLSTEAEAYTKPELEIYADDVKCNHGATVGQLNSESLFYLCARGISKVEAIKMLIDAFFDEIIAQVFQPEIKHYIKNRVGSHVEL